jgi:hypothetical protein
MDYKLGYKNKHKHKYKPKYKQKTQNYQKLIFFPFFILKCLTIFISNAKIGFMMDSGDILFKSFGKMI